MNSPKEKSEIKPPFATRNGWAIYHLPAFKHQYEGLVAEVKELKNKEPSSYGTHPKAKLLKRINEVIFDEVPNDPTHKDFRQGETLGPEHKDWFRAKFLGRFRLFFRFSSQQKMIIYCWMNDENSLRKEGAKTDPYSLFAKMLKAGTPPSDWKSLVEAATKKDSN